MFHSSMCNCTLDSGAGKGKCLLKTWKSACMWTDASVIKCVFEHGMTIYKFSSFFLFLVSHNTSQLLFSSLKLNCAFLLSIKAWRGKNYIIYLYTPGRKQAFQWDMHNCLWTQVCAQHVLSAPFVKQANLLIPLLGSGEIDRLYNQV